MASISFPSQHSKQTNEGFFLPKKLQFSDIPPSYTQISSLEGLNELIINVVMHTIKNICTARDPQQRKYLLSREDARICKVILSASGKETTILGCDLELGVFFSQNRNAISFYRMFNNCVQPLTEEQSKSIVINKQGPYYDQATRDHIAKIIKDLSRFAPPRIVCDVLEENKTKESQPSTKYLPLEPLSSEALLKELVCKNRGLFFGHNSSHIGAIGAVFETFLDQLSGWGVKHFYLPLPSAALHQQFALFNDNDPKRSVDLNALQESLKRYGVLYYQQVLKICLLAKKHGIEVWPVDETFSKLSEMSTIERVVTQRNPIISKNIKYYSSLLDNDQKYVCLLNAINYELVLDIPTIRIVLERNQEEKNISLSERELLNREKSDQPQEVETKLDELQKNLYEQLSLNEQSGVDHGYDAVLTLFPNDGKFALKLFNG